MAATSSNSRITFSDGYVMAYGRKVYIEEGTSIDITLDSSACGYVVVSIDTSQNKVTLHTKEKSSGYPALTQDNLLESDGKYELPICSYIKRDVRNHRSGVPRFLSLSLSFNQLSFSVIDIISSLFTAYLSMKSKWMGVKNTSGSSHILLTIASKTF